MPRIYSLIVSIALSMGLYSCSTPNSNSSKDTTNACASAFDPIKKSIETKTAITQAQKSTLAASLDSCVKNYKSRHTAETESALIYAYAYSDMPSQSIDKIIQSHTSMNQQYRNLLNKIQTTKQTKERIQQPQTITQMFLSRVSDWWHDGSKKACLQVLEKALNLKTEVKKNGTISSENSKNKTESKRDDHHAFKKIYPECKKAFAKMTEPHQKELLNAFYLSWIANGKPQDVKKLIDYFKFNYPVRFHNAQKKLFLLPKEQ
jgi:hypothetical protein